MESKYKGNRNKEDDFYIVEIIFFVKIVSWIKAFTTAYFFRKITQNNLFVHLFQLFLHIFIIQIFFISELLIQ